MTRKLDIEKYRSDWAKAIQWDKPFYLERPPLFGPAAAAQEGYGTCQVMTRFITNWIPWQYTNFVEEGMSFHETAFLGDWSSLIKLSIKGPDAQKFLSQYSTNDVHRFPFGLVKHAVQTDEKGQVAGEGVLYRVAEDHFKYQGGGADWLMHWFKNGKWDAEAKIDSPDMFVFHVQGPNSIDIVEQASGESFRDVRFLWSKPAKIAGCEVLVLRMGVTGELGYEIHGPSEAGNDVWLAIQEAGKNFGMKLMGRRAQIIGHVEAGIATIARDFLPAAAATPGKSKSHTVDMSGGSYEWSDPADLTRSPFELGWMKEVSLDTHDFLGREALQAEAKSGSELKFCGLIWNSSDLVDLYRAFFEDGPLPVPMEMPRESARLAMDPDKVLVRGKTVGCSTSRVYSPYMRKMISLCAMEAEFAAPGTEVSVIWGRRGGAQKEIRAVVVPLPFKEDKRRVDVAKAI